MFRIRFFSGVAMMGFVAAANAGTMTFLGNDVLNEQISISGTIHTATSNVGLLDFNESNLGNLKSFCADLEHSISGGQTWPDSLWNSSTYANTGIQLAGNMVAADFASVDTADKAAGMQLAIWEVRYDDPSNANPDFNSGNFTASGLSSGVLTAANAYWQDRFTPGNALFIRAEDGLGQDQLTPVPEPSSIAVLAIGGIVLLRRRKLRNQS